MSLNLYREVCYNTSKLITKSYSTSFSLATSLMEDEKKEAIYALYGFVRLADEIVDTFHPYNKEELLNKLQDDLDYALKHKISTNGVLYSFVDTVERFNISSENITAFMDSMRADLTQTTYHTADDMNKYIYGSADVVGLMCLKIFCNGNQVQYDELKSSAMRLGSAFQKVNFLRDLNDDLQVLGRSYFPELSNATFNEQTKAKIEKSIDEDFEAAYIGLRNLPGRSKLSVLVAFNYYNGLLQKIKRTPPQKIINQRVRISNIRKYYLILKTMLMYKLRLV
ncbi:phytoene/squalene synthase family protein [Saccharicrinis aurantiacus]|uniref:phytoene/squalene synthase family protein n=1 Tax=Saccharicrinis aurantiacus TaxID=1849719 RepID=UPI000839AB36|nr:phytoene/squalene synthase family protein [Saccharicrinis aurantiacus]